MKHVLITGVAGFIGMHSATRFLKEGWKVVGVDNINEYYSQKLKQDRLSQIKATEETSSGEFVFYEEDLNQGVLRQLDAITFDLCIHLAAQAGVRYSIENPRAYLEANILGFQEVLEFSSRNKKMLLLYASSSSVYGQTHIEPFNESVDTSKPESFYAATKKANELMAHAYFKTHGIHSIGLRFFTVYGPWGRPDMAPMLFAKAAYSNQTIRVFNYGRQKRDFTHINDVIESIYRLAGANVEHNGPKILNIGRGSPTSLMDFIGNLERELGKSLNKEFVEAQKGDVESTYADCSELEGLINYIPTISLEDGIQDFATWYRQYYNNDIV